MTESTYPTEPQERGKDLVFLDEDVDLEGSEDEEGDDPVVEEETDD